MGWFSHLSKMFSMLVKKIAKLQVLKVEFITEWCQNDYANSMKTVPVPQKRNKSAMLTSAEQTI